MKLESIQRRRDEFEIREEAIHFTTDNRTAMDDRMELGWECNEQIHFCDKLRSIIDLQEHLP